MNQKTLDTLRYFPVAPEVAWRRYLDTIRHADPAEYSTVEEAAWSSSRRHWPAPRRAPSRGLTVRGGARLAYPASRAPIG